MTNPQDQGAASIGPSGTSLVGKYKAHINLDQEVIVITEDRLVLVMKKFMENTFTKEKLVGPLSLVLTFMTVFCTSQFQDAWGINKDTWRAVFVLSTVIAVAWSVYSIFRFATKSMTIENFVDELKMKTQRQSSEEKPKKDAPI